MDVYRAIADTTRRAILDELLQRGGQSLFELCARLAMKHGISSTRQAISQHLEVLEAAGLVLTKRGGEIQAPLVRQQAARGYRQPVAMPSRGERVMRSNVSPAQHDGTELLLEPDSRPAVKPFKSALVEDGIPYASFAVDDVSAEYERLTVE